MRLRGNSCIYFEYEVYLLNYTIEIKKHKNLNWAFGFKKKVFKLKNLGFSIQFYSSVVSIKEGPLFDAKSSAVKSLRGRSMTSSD